MTPVVDDEYPLFRQRYERALTAFLAACLLNGRATYPKPTAEMHPADHAGASTSHGLDHQVMRLIDPAALLYARPEGRFAVYDGGVPLDQVAGEPGPGQWCLAENAIRLGAPPARVVSYVKQPYQKSAQ